jgi:hypothetical protein
MKSLISCQRLVDPASGPRLERHPRSRDWTPARGLAPPVTAGRTYAGRSGSGGRYAMSTNRTPSARETRAKSD